jgi:hypothetical protein
MVVYFMDTWFILRSFGIFYDNLVHFMFVWYIFSWFGILYLEKYGNPASCAVIFLNAVVVHDRGIGSCFD